jgi:hypothetical protein
MNGTGELHYTFLLWIETKGAPEEVLEKLTSSVRYRVGVGAEEDFTSENSNIREKNGFITITFRG